MDGGTSFECALDGAGFASCASPLSLTGVAEGAHAFHVRATDAAGNTGAATDYSWTVDTTAPTATVDSGPAAATNATGATFTFSSADGGTSFECALDAGAFAGCASPKSYAGLSEGAHAFHVRATDDAGNTGSAADFAWTVDTTAPTATIDSFPDDPTNATSADFDFSSADGGISFQCRVDGGALAACASPESYAGLTDGSHTFDVEATDAAGNTGAAASYTWTIDTTAPTTTIDGGPADPTDRHLGELHVLVRRRRLLRVLARRRRLRRLHLAGELQRPGRGRPHVPRRAARTAPARPAPPTATAGRST